MELSKTYSSQEVEDKWYKRWLDARLFESYPDEREPYCIVTPPPNVTGVLHMGHALNETVQDVLIRRARMTGYNTCWVPGTDHASISTEAKVVTMLREKGIEKNQISREEFLKYAWEWNEKYGGIILSQFKKLGLALDWKRTAFTLDDGYYKAVIHVFVELYNRGFIYRGSRMINWDPKAKTALSDEEVFHKEVNGKLYFVRYKLDGDKNEFITIATTRPETILGDTAICVHPDDERYKNLKGRFAFVPLLNRKVPIIFDEYIDQSFGTGALKVTPAHDVNDYNLGLKNNLEVIDVFNEDGTMSAAAQMYVGEDRFVVRKKIVKELEAQNFIVKIEEHKHSVGFSERTDVPIEPRLSLQWWCRMNEMAKPALDAVMNGDIEFHPAKFKNMYRNWMENIRDWCISRQLWWGQRIPAFYTQDGNFEVGENLQEAFEKLKIKNAKLKIEDVKQDEDVLDTWFSSWLWPMEVFHWNENPDNKDLAYYYPTHTLITAPEIIFFWVARMIMAGFEFKKQKPFSHVYFTGVVRDKQGRKMSKSLGNSPDLLELIDKVGADAVRFGILIASPAGNDLLYDEKLVEQGRNFNNKIWNALRLIKGWQINEALKSENDFAISWFENRLNEVSKEIENHFKEYNLSAALKIAYSLIWDDFCAWYLEMIKPEFEKPIDKITYDRTIDFFERLVQLLHPFMPFVTEEIFQHLRMRKENEFLIERQFNKFEGADSSILNYGNVLKLLVTSVRDFRSKNNLKPKEQLQSFFETNDNSLFEKIGMVSEKLAALSSFEKGKPLQPDASPFVIDKNTFYIINNKKVDEVQEKDRLQKELDYYEGFLKSVASKLKNEKFVANASVEVVNKEKQKADDAENKIKSIRESLKKISS
jgi:valyl-tRNA synthetase